MYFGADYYPEHWVFPYAGSQEDPEARWLRDADLMVGAGVNVVRMGEFSWGICEPQEGQFNFGWLRRAMDVMGQRGIKVVIGTPTAAPPLWLARKHPEILPIDEQGRRKGSGTRRAYCMNCQVYWDYSKTIVTQFAKELGDHEHLIAWQVDNGIGGHDTEWSFNEETRHDWIAWLRAKYETVERLNDQLGLRFWGQIVSDFEQVPMPQMAPAPHNPALVLDWMRFSSDTSVAYVRMQANLLKELTPNIPVTTTLREPSRKFDHFDMAEAIDFVSVDTNATIKSKSSENACQIDMLRSLKKDDIRTPEGDCGFWVMEQKAAQVNWQEVNSLVRPGVVRLFSYQQVSRGATALLFFFWRQPRIGSEKFYGGVLSHDGEADNRVYKEVSQIGEEMRILAPLLKGTCLKAEACILYTHDNDWTLGVGKQPNSYFNNREHLQLFYNALHDRNIPVDFARPTDDLSKYKLVIAPSLHQMAGGEADLLKLYVQNGGTLVSTFNTGLVDEHLIAPDTGYPHDLTDVFGMKVMEFDPLPPGEENHLIFKGAFPTTHLHPAKLWCDLIEPGECQIVATYAKDFYAGTPAITMNTYGLGRAIYIGTMSHQFFYFDLATWLRQLCNLHPLLKVPETVEVSMRERDGVKVFFLLNHQNSPIRLQFYKPVTNALTKEQINGNYDLPPHGVLVLEEHETENKEQKKPEETAPAAKEDQPPEEPVSAE